MAASWTDDDVRLLQAAGELEIAVERSTGELARWVPIWVVCAAGQVYVRTWWRRDTGWFGRALRSQRARVRVPGLEADVDVVDVGASVDVTGAVDAAYRDKYGPGGATSMVTPDARASTLRLDPRSPGPG